MCKGLTYCTNCERDRNWILTMVTFFRISIRKTNKRQLDFSHTCMLSVRTGFIFSQKKKKKRKNYHFYERQNFLFRFYFPAKVKIVMVSDDWQGNDERISQWTAPVLYSHPTPFGEGRSIIFDGIVGQR